MGVFQPAPVYLDYAATAPVLPEVAQAMAPWLTPGQVGNPSSIHQAGRKARTAIEDARDQVADALGVHPLNVLFTSGATEANNIAIWGAINTAQQIPDAPLPHVLAGATDHPSVLEPLRHAQRSGQAEVTIANPHPIGTPACGRLDADQFIVHLQPNTALIVGTVVTSELGVIQPVDEWQSGLAHAQIGEAKDLWWHLDATQAMGRLDLRPLAAHATSLALSAHKVGGPQGIGVLVLDRAKEVASPILGGGQERGVRSGTIPVALVVGAGEAIAHAEAQREGEYARLLALKTSLIEGLAGSAWTPTIDPAIQVPGIVHITAPQTDTETVVMALDRAGICVSAGSACQSGALKESALIGAIGVTADMATIRLSFGWATTQDDCVRAIEALRAVPTGTHIDTTTP